MPEILRPKLARVIELAHTQGSLYDLAFENHLAPPAQQRLMRNGQLYLERLRHIPTLPSNAYYLREIYTHVEETGLQALSLRLHLAGDTVNMSRLVIGCADADPRIQVLEADEPELKVFRIDPVPDVELLEASIQVNIQRSPFELAGELIWFSYYMERANKTNSF